MKIRTDFVTNSSSSSFIAWGFTDTPEDLKSAIIRKSGLLEMIDPDEDEDEMDVDSWELIDYITENTPFDASGGYDGDQLMIGIHPETVLGRWPTACIGNIKALIAKEFTDTFGVTILEEQIEFVAETWYD